ncbi:glucose-6-phosphate isomerase [Leeuwenhoekiella sp. LLG6367-2.1]|uniref:glucose-6-phosphate isomerase n=1 Tax=Leeuwenhoekiella sp. LLG6367-2.1 TaxID=3160833 RepID=UPI003869EF96
MQKVNPTQTKAWKALQEHFNEVKNLEMKTLFEDDSRAEAFSISWEDFYVDYSKNRITSTTKSLLLDLAKEMNLEDAKQAYFNGSEINETEGRAVMHTALRQPEQATIEIDGQNVITEVNEVKEKIKGFCDTVISGSHKGFTGKAITDVVNIGIGGSDLGPNMVAEALAYYHNHLKVHFISNVDGDHVHESLKYLNPETTLFVIVSKTFTTQETLSNANTARKWFLSKVAGTVQEGEAVAKHFVAVSTNEEAVKEFGIDPNNVFTMWDWVGGRFSLWSSVGLSIALAVGFENFDKMLAGAHKADEHFKNTDLEENIPVLMALVTVWYNNFFKAESEAIIPYSQYLNRFAAYLQQAIMESNGKSVDRNGNPVDYQTGQIVWGEPGTNSQHAFFQLIHQGTKLIPTHFIGFKNSLHGDVDHHNKLMANFFAQTEALMNGKTEEEAREELESTNMDASAIEKLVPFKVFDGNKPTTTILIDKLTPESLGSLIAIYEHKIFTEGILWNIFSYDQWGVELGKQLAKNVLTDLNSDSIASHDSSTTSLINRFKS